MSDIAAINALQAARDQVSNLHGDLDLIPLSILPDLDPARAEELSRRCDMVKMALRDLANSLNDAVASLAPSDSHTPSPDFVQQGISMAKAIRSTQMELNRSLGELVNGMLYSAIYQASNASWWSDSLQRPEWEGWEQQVSNLILDDLGIHSDNQTDEGSDSSTKNGALMLALRYICHQEHKDVRILANPMFKGWEDDESTTTRREYRSDFEFNNALSAIQEGLATAKMEASYAAQGFTTHLQHKLRLTLDYNPEKPNELYVHEWRPDALLYIPNLELKVAIEMKVNTRRGRSSSTRTARSIAQRVFDEWNQNRDRPFRNITRSWNAQRSLEETLTWEQIKVVPIVAVSDVSSTAEGSEGVSYFPYIPGARHDDVIEFHDLSELIEVLQTSNSHPFDQMEFYSEPFSNRDTPNDVDGGSVRRIVLD